MSCRGHRRRKEREGWTFLSVKILCLCQPNYRLLQEPLHYRRRSRIWSSSAWTTLRIIISAAKPFCAEGKNCLLASLSYQIRLSVSVSLSSNRKVLAPTMSSPRSTRVPSSCRGSPTRTPPSSAPSHPVTIRVRGKRSASLADSSTTS